MNISSMVVKKTARTALKGNYFKGVVASTIIAFVWIVLSVCASYAGTFAGIAVANLAFILFLMFLMIPLILGFVYFSVRLIFSNDCDPVTVVKYFSNRRDYFKALKLSLTLTGNMLFYSFVFFLPVAICNYVASGEFFKTLGMQIPVWASGVWVVSYILRILATVLFINVMLKFYLAPFLISANEDMDPFEALHISKTIAFASKREFIFLILSFALYIIACVFVLPLIFIFPYFAVAYAVHCRYAVAEYNKNVDKTNSNNAPSFEASISF